MRKLKKILLLFFSLLFTSPIYSQWFEQTLPVGGTMYDMVFFDANTGVISFDSRNVIRTTNGGNNWSVVGTFYVFNLKKVDDMAVYGNGRYTSDVIYRSYDRGATWDSVLNTEAAVRDIWFANRDTGWISLFGKPSGIYKTTNGGQSMFLLSSQASDGKINFINRKYNGEYFGWNVTDVLRLTTNSGVNWYMPSNGLDSINFGSVSFINKDSGWATGVTNFSYGRIYYTSNGGINWIKQYEEFAHGPTDITFTSFNKGWAGRDGTKIFATSNGGQIWGFQNIPINTVTYFYMLDSLIGWCGRTNKLLHTINGGGNIVKIISYNNTTPVKYLLKQNYPNPFNPTSIIEFSIKDKANVSLIIYDIQGREVTTLFSNKELIPGEYKSIADFSDKNLSSGIYFYKLIIQGKVNLVLTKKMTFIK